MHNVKRFERGVETLKYIFMCGGDYKLWETPRQFIKINGEPIIARSIRLAKECGVKDIAISSNNPMFEQLGVPVLKHENKWEVRGHENASGTWVNGFYPMNEPVCYLLGDVVFSKAAMQKIVDTQTDGIEFFASAPPFAKDYMKEYAEPFAFKVYNIEYFNQCIRLVKHFEEKGMFNRHPIAWELWQVIRKTPLNVIDYTNYTVINDYTCDIDWANEARIFEKIEATKE